MRMNNKPMYLCYILGQTEMGSEGMADIYYPIHKVKIPKTVYGDPKSLSILLNYKPHCNAENPKYIISDEIASIMYTGGTMKRDNKNETHK